VPVGDLLKILFEFLSQVFEVLSGAKVVFRRFVYRTGARVLSTSSSTLFSLRRRVSFRRNVVVSLPLMPVYVNTHG